MLCVVSRHGWIITNDYNQSLTSLFTANYRNNSANQEPIPLSPFISTSPFMRYPSPFGGSRGDDHLRRADDAVVQFVARLGGHRDRAGRDLFGRLL